MFTAVTKGPVKIEVCKVKGSKFQEIEVEVEKMYRVKNCNTGIAKI